MYLITGGAGFIGSNIAKGLEEAGEKDIVIVDRLGQNDKWKNIAKRELRDIVPPEDLLYFLETHQNKIKAIIHMGAISTTTEKNVDKIIENNFDLSVSLWDWATENKVRFIYASSAATYGDGSNGFKDFWTPEALSKLSPLNPYGWSKHLFDRRVARTIKELDQTPPQWVGLKFFNVYGPNEYHKGDQQSVALHLTEQIKKDGKANLFKSYRKDYKHGEQKRDFIWVGDCVDIILWFINNPKKSGIFNVGTGKARTFNDLAKTVFKILNKKERINYISMPSNLKKQYQYFTEADISSLRKIGYKKPFTSLDKGINTYLRRSITTDDWYI
jgi:ADP-L-glycero-D-manno-heptose 6-epimerase